MLKRRMLCSALVLATALSTVAGTISSFQASGETAETQTKKVEIVDEFLISSWLSYYGTDKKSYAEQTKELAEAAEAEASAKALRQEYEAKLANIEKEADAILGEARKRALISENQIIAEAKAEARRIMDRAHVEAELEKSKLADEVKTEMIQIAAVLAGKVVAANINTEIQAELIDETLKEIGEDTWLS